MKRKNGRSWARARRGAGFTLIEVMIVIAIILALTGIVGVAVLGRQKEAKHKLAEIDMGNIKAAMKQFRLDHDRWPTEQEGLAVLWDKSVLDAETDAAKWKKYLDEPLPNDRWGSPWGYRPISEHGDEDTYDIWSYGPDKQDGTDDDITSWPKDSEGGTNPASSGSGGSRGG